MDDTLMYDGGAVKALGGGRIGGYLVLFSGPNDPDLERDYFTKSTDFFIDSGDQRPILYRHGVHPLIKSRKLGKATLTIDDLGVFAEGELELRDKYEKFLYTMAEKGKLGWSSGSMNHLVEKSANGKSFEVISWPIGEASLTPTPVEGRTRALPLKELASEGEIDFDAGVKSLEQEESDHQFSIDGIPSLKSFCEAVAPNSLKDGVYRSQSAADAVKGYITYTRILGEAYDSYTSRLVKRTENRFLKEGREIDASTIAQNEQAIADIEKIESAFASVKESLLGIRRISEMTKAEQRAMDEKARLALWNYSRISGFEPKELNNAASTSEHV